jgi:hypothetical protein
MLRWGMAKKRLGTTDVDRGPGRVVEEYQNDMKCKEFVSVIADVIKQELTKNLSFI